MSQQSSSSKLLLRRKFDLPKWEMNFEKQPDELDSVLKQGYQQLNMRYNSVTRVEPYFVAVDKAIDTMDLISISDKQTEE